MVVLEISLFHLICCFFGACIIYLNLTFSQNGNQEFILYTIYSFIIIISYFLFGYKVIDDYNTKLKTHMQIWIISVILVLISIVDVWMACMLNLSFQPLSALFYDYLTNERFICIITSLLPSILMYIGYIYKLIKESHM